MIALGTRWPVGDEPSPRLPQAVVDAILDLEEALARENVDTKGWYWTLTYLETRPVCELDDGTRILYNPTTDEAHTIAHDAE